LAYCQANTLVAIVVEGCVEICPLIVELDGPGLSMSQNSPIMIGLSKPSARRG